MSWIIEGSNDFNNWEILSEVKNTSTIDGKNYVHTFSIQNQSNHKFKYIKIRQTDVNFGNNHQLWIGAFEIFGNLI